MRGHTAALNERIKLHNEGTSFSTKKRSFLGIEMINGVYHPVRSNQSREVDQKDKIRSSSLP